MDVFYAAAAAASVYLLWAIARQLEQIWTLLDDRLPPAPDYEDDSDEIEEAIR